MRHVDVMAVWHMNVMAVLAVGGLLGGSTHIVLDLLHEVLDIGTHLLECVLCLGLCLLVCCGHLVLGVLELVVRSPGSLLGSVAHGLLAIVESLLDGLVGGIDVRLHCSKLGTECSLCGVSSSLELGSLLLRTISNLLGDSLAFEQQLSNILANLFAKCTCPVANRFCSSSCLICRLLCCGMHCLCTFLGSVLDSLVCGLQGTTNSVGNLLGSTTHSSQSLLDCIGEGLGSSVEEGGIVVTTSKSSTTNCTEAYTTGTNGNSSTIRSSTECSATG